MPSNPVCNVRHYRFCDVPRFLILVGCAFAFPGDERVIELGIQLEGGPGLTFRPSSNEPGFHAIEVQVLHQPETVTVKARESYWATRPSQ